MGFQEVADLDCSNSVSLGGTDRKTGKANPTQVEGFYIGTRQVASAKARSGFCALHIFQTSKGNLGVWGKTNLDQKLGGVTPGTMTRVTFVGMVETKNNPMYKYKVELDKTNTIEVGGAETAAASTGISQGYQDDEDSADDLFDDAPAADEPPPARAKTAAAARTPDAASQARVKELLASRTKALR